MINWRRLVWIITVQLLAMGLSWPCRGQARTNSQGQPEAAEQGSDHTKVDSRKQLSAAERVDLWRRARQGDRDAMKWAIGEQLGYLYIAPGSPFPFSGIPDTVDQTALVIELLQGAIAHPGREVGVREMAMAWLGATRDPRALNWFRECATNHVLTPFVRQEALEQLVGRFTKQCHDILASVAEDPDPEVRLAVARALLPLEQLEPTDAQLLRRLTKDPDRRVRAEALLRLGDRDANGRLIIPPWLKTPTDSGPPDTTQSAPVAPQEPGFRSERPVHEGGAKGVAPRATTNPESPFNLHNASGKIWGFVAVGVTIGVLLAAWVRHRFQRRSPPRQL